MSQLRELFNIVCSRTLTDAEWQEAQQEFPPAAMAAEIVAADYEGCFSGDWGATGLDEATHEFLHELQA